MGNRTSADTSRLNTQLTLFLVVTAAIICLTEIVICGLILKKQPCEKNELFCLKCPKNLGSGIGPEESHPLFETVSTRTKNGVLECCVKNSEQIPSLFEMASRKRLETKAHAPRNDTTLKFTPVSAHKQLLPSVSFRNLKEPVFNDGHNIPIINSHHNDYLTEHIRGINIEHDSFIIASPGLYYIYSSVHFRPVSERPAGQFQYQLWFQYIHRQVPNDPQKSGVLLQTAHTVHDNSTSNQETAFSGGVFYLEAGDQIQVCFSSLGLVQFSKESTFAGLMMIASGSYGN